MKTTTLLTVLIFVSITTAYAKKKTNGTVYIDHPAIETVEAMTKSFVSGDSTKVASYLADEFRAINGVSTNANDKGQDKASFARNAKNWQNSLDYFSITRADGAYPDAIEYKDENQKDVVWVQTWEVLKGVHKKTGVKVNMPIHRLYTVNKDNKIRRVITYSNSSIGDEIRQSNIERTNGTIYNHHENINTVRKMIYAVENKDLEKAYSFYDDNAQFTNTDSSDGKDLSLAEQKAQDKMFLDNFEVASADMVGYPDYLHYELDDARVVMSWWNYNLIRKTDKKKMTLPVHYINGFNKEGKIISETAYYNAALLSQK